MYISRVEISGFKSFDERIVLDLSAGISCVIGPNGCGKSNVIDAIKWVLGEQSLKSLRGKSSQELVFNGTKRRKPKGMAEVSITIVDDRNALLDTIVIKRRFYRSGEGEFYINQAPVRLKDIINLLSELNISANSYSILEQDNVSSILETKPEDRRFLIEEAAGLLKYKNHQRETIRKITQTKENLNRACDILLEVEKQRNSLKYQCRKAERYKNLSHKIKEYELNLLKVKLNKTIEAISTISKEEQNLQINNDELSKNIESERGKLNETEVRVISESEKIKTLESEFEKMKDSINELDKNIARKQNQLDNLCEVSKKADEEIAKRISERASFNAALNKNSDQLLEEENRLKKLEDESEKVFDEYEKLHGELTKLEQSLNDLNREVQEKRTNVEQKNGMILHYEREIKNRKSVLSDKYKDDESLKLHLLENIVLAENGKKQNLPLEKSLSLLLENGEKMASLLSELQVQKSSLENNYNSLTVEFERTKSRFNEVNQILHDFSDHEEAVQNLMKKRDVFKNIRGIVSDIVDVTPEYETALLAILDSRISGIIFDGNPNDLLTFQRNNARCLLIPQGNGNTREREPLPRENGVIGYISDVVKCDDNYRGTLNYLLGDTILVDNFENAESVKKSFLKSVVTLDGEVIDDGNAIACGRLQKDTTKRLNRKREKESLASECTKYNSLIKIQNRQLEELKNEFLSLEKQIGENQRLKDSIEHKISEINSEFERMVNSLSPYDRKRELIRYEIITKKGEINELERDLTRTRRENENEISLFDEMNNNLVLLRSDFESRQKSFRDVEERKTELKIDKVSLSAQITILNNKITEDNERIKKSITEENYYKERINEWKNENLRLNDEIRRDHNSLAQMADRREEIKDELTALNENFNLLNNLVSTIRNEIERIESSRSEIKDLLNEKKVENATYLTEQKNIIEHALDKYFVDLNTYSLTEGSVSSETEVEEMKAELAKIEDVNLSAINEYEEVNKRYQFIKKQIDDLNASLTALYEIMERIDKISKSKFEDAFIKINENFGMIFKEIFGGGEASLKLLDENNILESGIEIMVSPPGKKSMNLNLLSGGEKTMVVISLLVATYYFNPTPICIMDEVDAPLDEVNVGRFKNLLARISKDSQIIVVTHNKRTMESADRLYGITMEEEGVSKLISVSFKDNTIVAAA